MIRLTILFTILFMSCEKNPLIKNETHLQLNDGCIQGSRNIQALAQYLNEKNCIYYSIPLCAGSNNNNETREIIIDTTSNNGALQSESISAERQREIVRNFIMHINSQIPKNCYITSIRFNHNMIYTPTPQDQYLSLIANVTYKCCQ